MKKPRGVRIAKRDGSLEFFQIDKLKQCVAHGMRSCGYDERFAEPLARAVAMHLREWRDSRPPSTDYIFRCVRGVLGETGLEDVAHELAMHRRRRAARRRAVAVYDTRRMERPATTWNKGSVAATLERRYGVRTNTARILASEIEQRVLALNYNAVSTALIGELIRSELMAWGVVDEPALATEPRGALAGRACREDH